MKSEFRVRRSCLLHKQTAAVGVLDVVWVRGFFHTLMKVVKSELQHYRRKGSVLFWQYRLLHRIQTCAPSIRAGRGYLGTPSHVPQFPVLFRKMLQKQKLCSMP